MGTTQQVILTTTVTASAALTQQRFVGADNGPCQAGAVALGVAEVDAAAGDVTPVNVLGTRYGQSLRCTWYLRQRRHNPDRSQSGSG